MPNPENQIDQVEDGSAKVAKAKPTVEEAIAEHSDQLEAALAGSIPTPLFLRSCATVYRKGGQRMREADWGSFVIAMIEAATLHLMPGGVLGDCYIIPRFNKDTGMQWAYFQLGYRGTMKLARRGGEVTDIHAELVYENDKFMERKGTTREIEHIPYYCNGQEKPGDVILAYSTATLKTGEVSFNTITRAEIEAAAELSGKGYGTRWSPAWQNHFGAMARKTTIHRHGKYLPMPDDAKEAIVRDEYREAGVAEAKLSLAGFEAERRAISGNPDFQNRKDYDQAVDKCWRKASKFFAQMEVVRTREAEGREQQDAFVMWMAARCTGGEVQEWPEATDRDGRIYFLRHAIAGLDRWIKEDEEDKQASCDEFRSYIDEAAADKVFGEDRVSF